jgi:hypothetical protein
MSKESQREITFLRFWRFAQVLPVSHNYDFNSFPLIFVIQGIKISKKNLKQK